jgi:hypothetical protein
MRRENRRLCDDKQNSLSHKDPKLLLPIIFAISCSTAQISFVQASSGSPFFQRSRRWGSATTQTSPLPTRVPSSRPGRLSSSSLQGLGSNRRSCREDQNGKDDNALDRQEHYLPPRGGQASAPDLFLQTVGSIAQGITACGKIVLPPMVTLVSFILKIYRGLPMDAIVAQIGLVYCFAGGYYPTLFSSLQAAQHCGWNVMVQAIQDLTDEATRVAKALSLEDVQTAKYGFDDEDHASAKRQQLSRLFAQRTSIVMATLDPEKINQAAGALYTTWLGVSSVLEKEYARVITLSLTLAHYIERIATFVLAPPAYLCVQQRYHQWVPVVIGWGCKAAAMNIAWRIQRLLTAATSAMTGGLLFARAITRMLSKRGIRWFGLIPDVKDNHEATAFDEVIGFMLAAVGFYTQFETQWKSGFSFRVPFPLYLLTWPFDWAERWIQWQITK